MSDFDEELKKMAHSESREVPAEVHDRIEETLKNLPERIAFPRRHHTLKVISGIAACLILVLLVVMPNVSVAYAEAAGKLPVIGKLIQVFTVRRYAYQDDHYELDAEVPEVNAPDEQEIAALINQDVDQLTQTIIRKFYRDMELQNHEGHGSIYIDYETVSNTPDWFTLKLAVTETAGSSDNYFRFYHIDRQKGRYVNFGDLFDGKARAKIARMIEDQMQQQMEEDPDVVYKIDGNNGKVQLDENQNFYFEENGDLVVVFDKYKVAPGYMGNPEFTIPRDRISPCLKIAD